MPIVIEAATQCQVPWNWKTCLAGYNSQFVFQKSYLKPRLHQAKVVRHKENLCQSFSLIHGIFSIWQLNYIRHSSHDVATWNSGKNSRHGRKTAERATGSKASGKGSVTRTQELQLVKFPLPSLGSPSPRCFVLPDETRTSTEDCRPKVAATPDVAPVLAPNFTTLCTDPRTVDASMGPWTMSASAAYTSISYGFPTIP